VLAAALQPAFIRFGGNSHSHLIYNMSAAPLPALPPLPPPAYQPPRPTTVMSAVQWDRINDFAAATNWTTVFALNALLRVKDGTRSGRWDTTAAASLLRHTFDVGRVQKWTPVVWELSNEPDLAHYAYNISDHSVFPVPPKQLVADHRVLRALLSELSPAATRQEDLLVVGPDVANAGSSGGRK
jgi:hypothetical protein